jgi:hypothetical protein
MRALTKSTLAFARTALETGKRSLPSYSHSRSPHKYTLPQLFAILSLRDFLGTDYRGITAILAEWSDLRAVLGLTDVPHYSTLCYAERKLLKKTPLHA